MKYIFKSEEDTIAFGEKLGRLAEKGMVFCLEGDLGAGKTTLTKGIAKGLDITKTITSPTFTILKIYEGRFPLYHFDAYRLEGVSQDLGFDEYFDGDGLAVIEWSQFLKTYFDNYLLIEITINDDGHRIINLDAHGEVYTKMVEDIKC